MNTEEIIETTETEDMETVVEVDTSIEILTQIYNDVHIIMVFTIITFVTACLRGWRKNVVRGL